MSHPSREINGPRPSPLKVHKQSHQIQKPSTAGTTTASHPQRSPVIIYTQSPKIIHTHARDFMALVQKLTGLSPDDRCSHVLKSEPSSTEPMPVAPSTEFNVDADKSAEGAHEESGEVVDVIPAGLELDHMFPDMSLSSEFFCSPRNVYTGGESISPSFIEF